MRICSSDIASVCPCKTPKGYSTFLLLIIVRFRRETSAMFFRKNIVEDDDDDLTVIDPAMGVTKVEVDPMVQDGVLLSTRLPSAAGTPKSSGFWSTARGVFFSTLLTTVEVSALRTGETEVSTPGSATKQKIDHEEAYLEPETPRLGEEKQFAQLMHDEWIQYLEEEILLLRIERHNMMLEQEVETASMRRSTPKPEASVANLLKSPWSTSGKEPTHTGADESEPFSEPTTSPQAETPSRALVAVRRQMSMPPRPPTSVTLPPLAIAIANERPPGKSRAMRRFQNMAAVEHLRPISSLDEEHEEDRTALDDMWQLKPCQTLPSNIRLALPKVDVRPIPKSVPAGAAKSRMGPRANSHEQSSTKDLSLRHPRAIGRSGPGAKLNGDSKQAWMRWRSISHHAGSEVPKKRHTRNASLGTAQELYPSASRAGLQRSSSGVRAAIAAAEAAATGGKRIRRVWERMKRMVAPKQGEAKMPGGSALTNALQHGEIFEEQRGPAWVAVACSETEDDLLSRSRYQDLLRQPSKYAKEIERDVNRTFPLHSKFQEERGPGQKALFNVVKAYAVWDQEVGYCQGMGFVAATLLMHMEEEDAFCCLVYLLSRCGLRAVFLPNMEQLQVRLYQLSQLILECLPRLHSHFEALEIKPVMYAADWFLTLFARTLPLYLVSRVFDIIMAEKTTAIVFKLAIVMLQVCRRQLLQCPEMEFVMNFLRAELPDQLKALAAHDLEELVAKALRVELPFESLLRLEAEYELLAEEAATAAREVQAAAAASEAAAANWEESRRELEERLLHALQAQAEAEAAAEALQRQVDSLSGQAAEESSGPAPSGACPGEGGHDAEDGREGKDSDADEPASELRTPGMTRFQRKLGHDEIEGTKSLLRRVSALRKERAAVSEALDEAERALGDRLRQENQRIGSEGEGPVPEHVSMPAVPRFDEGMVMSSSPRVSKAAMGYQDTGLGQLHAGHQTFSNPTVAWAKEPGASHTNRV